MNPAGLVAKMGAGLVPAWDRAIDCGEPMSGGWREGRWADTMAQESLRTKALEHYLRGWPLVGVLIITIACSFWTYDLTRYAIINGVYGTDAWAGGLRVIDKHGHLSDGRVLSGFHRIVLNFGSFLLCAPVFVGSAFGLAYLNMRLHGKRLSEFGPAESASSQN